LEIYLDFFLCFSVSKSDFSAILTLIRPNCNRFKLLN
jgi:hypothetical protein